MGAAGAVQGKPRHFTGTATTTPTNVIITNDKGIAKFARYLEISNLDATNTLQFSFDNGASWTSIKPTSSTNPQPATREVPGTVQAFMVRTTASTAAYEAIAVIAE